MATLILQRTSKRFGRWRKLEIVIDQNDVVLLKDGAQETVQVMPGDHVLVARMDWCKSKPLTVNLVEGESVTVLADSIKFSWLKNECFTPPYEVFTLKPHRN